MVFFEVGQDDVAGDDEDGLGYFDAEVCECEWLYPVVCREEL